MKHRLELTEDEIGKNLTILSFRHPGFLFLWIFVQQFIILSAILAVTLAAPAVQPETETEPPATILKSEFEKHEDGSYEFL